MWLIGRRECLLNQCIHRRVGMSSRAGWCCVSAGANRSAGRSGRRRRHHSLAHRRRTGERLQILESMYQGRHPSCCPSCADACLGTCSFIHPATREGHFGGFKILQSCTDSPMMPDVSFSCFSCSTRYCLPVNLFCVLPSCDLHHMQNVYSRD